MASRALAIGIVAVLAGMTAASAVAPLRLSPVPARTAGSAPLHIFGGRSEAQAASRGGAKFDAALASIARHLPTVTRDQALSSLRSLNPGMRFVQPRGAAEPLVLIDAVTRGDPAQLKAALLALGLQHAAQFSNDVGGWLPVSQLDAASEQAEVHSIRAAMPMTRSGAVTTQGDFVLHADEVRSQNALDGTGITVGILSDSYNCYAEYAKSGSGVSATGPDGYANNGFNTTAAGDISTGDLPASSKLLIVKDATEVELNGTVYGCNAYDPTLQLPFGDEGRAMMQIVHDVAPGATLAFYTAEQSEADFASGIVALAAPLGGGSGNNGAGAQIIADDVGYFDEPFFQDGIVAQAINQVVADGVIYFSAAGNNGETAFDTTTPGFTAVAAAGTTNAGEKLLDFGGGATSQSLTIPALIPGEFVVVVVEWDQPFVTGAPNSGGSTSSIDLCLLKTAGATNTIIDDSGSTLTTGCTGGSTVGQDPVQLILIGNPASATTNSAAETLNIQVGLKSGTTPGRVKVAVEANGADVTFAKTGATMQGHPYASGAIAVGAAFYLDTPACGTAVPVMESFSSRGGDPLLFSVSGTRLATPTARNKPDLTGPDGGNDTFLGFTLSSDNPANSATGSCKNNTSYPNFLGTSAATPHLAALAALYLQANPAVTPAQMLTYMAADAVPTDKGATFGGAGFVQGDKAATLVPIANPPSAPLLTLAPTSITAGQSTTLSWSSYNNTGCTASGAWTGPMASNGSQMVAPANAGSYTYSLTCDNVAGTSAAGAVTLTVAAVASTPASSGSGGGGGALDITGLLALAVALAGRRNRPLPSTRR